MVNHCTIKIKKTLPRYKTKVVRRQGFIFRRFKNRFTKLNFLKGQENEMNNYILTDSFNWADEIDFSGFIVVTEDVLNKLRKYLNSKRGEIETFYIGTNEEIECDIDEYADYLEDIEPIDSKELEIIEKHLGSSIGETLKLE